MRRHWACSALPFNLFIAGVPAMGQKFDPVANPKSVHIVPGGNTRLTFLTKRILRVEWSPDGRFEDRASFAFVNRGLPPANLDGMGMGGTVGCTDGTFWVFYPACGSKQFAIDKIIISRPGMRGNPEGTLVEWTPGTLPTRNLKGTIRTLDNVSGSCPLEDGLLSRDGWTVIDDSRTLLLDGNNTDWPWAAPRRHPDAIDLYFFAYGDDYRGALADFTKIAGKIPLPPRYVFGSWWSRYWAYTDAELKDIVRQFDEHDVPLDVLVIDMDWHLDGWTGYTWNKKYFPDSAGFLKWCKDNELFVTLNLHPADGVGKHEAMFHEFKAAMGITDKTCYRVPFDCTDRKYIENYFKFLHHPEEAKGIDFWWMDWQQGNNTKITGLDPLYWLNYLHWTDFERRSEQGFSLPGQLPAPPGKSYGDKRPLIFSRWGGLGNHRYQVGFSGDTFNNWESLAFQPYFTATAANVGYGYWSHDIGGHQPGPVEPELYARWVQFGAFSPVLRTHCGNRPDAERRIWAFPDEVFKACREAFQLRYALIPYIYTACRGAYDTGISLSRPLYYRWPREDQAYENPDQYMFGDDLMLAPVVSPANPVSGVASADVWFPPTHTPWERGAGWVEWASGRVYGGDGTAPERRLSFALNEIPVFARSGAVIPMQPKMARTGEKPVDPLILTIFDAGPKGAASGSGKVYEDDGITSGYERGEHAFTSVTHRMRDGVRTVIIGAADGKYEGMPESRGFEVRMPFVLPPEVVSFDGVELPRRDTPEAGAWWYESDRATVFIRTLPGLDVRKSRTLMVGPSGISDAPLRAGLMGQLRVIDDVLATLGESAPVSIREAAGIRTCLAVDPGLAMARAAALQADWWKFMDEIHSCAAPAPAREKAQARLLGLACATTLKFDEQGRVVAETSVAFAPRFDRAHDVEVSVSFAAGGGWVLSDEAGHSTRLKLGAGLTARAVLTGADPKAPAGGTISTRVSIDAEGSRIAMASTDAFCPSINAWQVLGPFDMAPEDEIRTAHIDEKAPVDLERTFVGAGGKTVGWRPARRVPDPLDDPRKDFFVNLQSFFGPGREDAVAYGVTWVESPDDRRVTVALGSDDGAAVWVNGVEVFRKFVQRGYNAREDRFDVALKKGRNELLIKVGQLKGAWGFSAHIEDGAGNPVPDVVATA